MTKCREQDVCSFISWVFSLRWLSRKRRGILTVFGASHFSESKIQSREVHQDVPFCGSDRQQHLDRSSPFRAWRISSALTPPSSPVGRRIRIVTGRYLAIKPSKLPILAHCSASYRIVISLRKMMTGEFFSSINGPLAKTSARTQGAAQPR
jgi:hypothetical protein